MRQFPTPPEPGADPHFDPWTNKLWDGLLADSIRRGRDCIEVLPPDSRRMFTIRGHGPDGWEDIMVPIGKMHRAFLRRLKVMAGFGLVRGSPAERGRFHFSDRDRVYDVDVTVTASPDGAETAVVRLLVQPAQESER